MPRDIYAPLPVNAFRRDVLAGKRLIGCWCALGSPVTAEILGLAGFDWLLLDSEHALNDVLTFVPQLMALKDSRSAPVVRPAWNDAVLIKRLLDAGFFNFLIPYVTSREEAEHAVAALRYPPRGMRGVSVSHRGNKWGTVKEYHAIVNDQICCIVQIEDRKGLENIDGICAVDGVDAVFVGPSDLSAGLGHMLEPDHPEVQDAIRHIVERAKANGKAAGILAPKEADARRYLNMGVTVMAVGSDNGLLRAAGQALRDAFIK
jgi:2-dehydro-3-deoxyglucarate aldolase